MRSAHSASISSTAFREDGTTDEEPAANLQFNNESPIILANAFPNPTSGKLNLRFNTMNSALIQILISDLTGRLVTSQSFGATAGENFTTLDLGDIDNGTYQIILTDGTHRSTSLFIKQ